MIGIFIGVKNNSSQKHSIRLDYSQIKKSIILETFIKFVEKICYRKTLKDLKKYYKNKENPNKQHYTIFYH